MPPSAHKSQPPSIPNRDEPSRVNVSVRPLSRMLPVVEAIQIHTDLRDIVFRAIMDARRRVEGVVANDDGQGQLFQGDPEGGMQVPELQADEIIAQAQAKLSERGILLERTADAIRITGQYKSEDPFAAIGYKR